MPHIENDIKLDFKDVLIRPKRSTIKSRADVDITRQHIFRHSKRKFPENVVPIIAANMDTIGTFEMALVLSKYQLLTCIHKHYTVQEWLAFAKEHPDVIPYVIYTSGMTKQMKKKLLKF